MGSWLKWSWADAAILAIGASIGSIASAIYLHGFWPILKSRQFTDFVLKTKVTDWLIVLIAFGAAYIASKALRWNRFQAQKPLIEDQVKLLQKANQELKVIGATMGLELNQQKDPDTHSISDKQRAQNLAKWAEDRINHLTDEELREFISKEIGPPFDSFKTFSSYAVDFDKSSIQETPNQQYELILNAFTRLKTKNDRALDDYKNHIKKMLTL